MLKAARSAFTSAGDAVRAQNDARGVMVQVAGGLVLLLGAYVTWRQLQLSREGMRQSLDVTNAQLKAAQDQLTIAGGPADPAVHPGGRQLGNEQIVARLGGIYALERLARNSAADAGTVAELLCSYIRQHSPRAADWAVRRALPEHGALPEDNQVPIHLELRGAQLAGASLLGVTDLDRAYLKGAVADDKTIWPAGFSPGEAGVIVIPAEDETTVIGRGESRTVRSEKPV